MACVLVALVEAAIAPDHEDIVPRLETACNIHLRTQCTKSARLHRPVFQWVRTIRRRVNSDVVRTSSTSTRWRLAWQA